MLFPRTILGMPLLLASLGAAELVVEPMADVLSDLAVEPLPKLAADPVFETVPEPAAEPLSVLDDYVDANIMEALSMAVSKTWTCPLVGTNAQHTYTENQARAVLFPAVAKHQTKGPTWDPPTTEDPHHYGNREGLAFAGCNGKSGDLWEVVIQPPGITDKGPDRVAYQAIWTKGSGGSKKLTPSLCGIMRHAANRKDFVLCP
ncbi:hypothetical protein MAPG_07278 [Magnaporthiopsis poae ATCC 64411]|uniref:Uncharacterized protein n=1 Tax=Magnaporthiopsis poae (strain ATCC 64411 / 73-15) TaxID=644358 RepID=A0A0C4E487_MAGP6|nr:hypothetical protein MAPG_07278 [Magnaporthiopsis poae ATCC 64411]